ncbi:MAG TPA: S-layer homology domain-containing protein [Acidimicrobiia bacterium]|nr:S-layer homology domain-containing protein [Acidimicrobiia bacterium]
MPTSPGRRASTGTALAFAVILLVMTSVPVSAQTDPFGSDPLGLISFKEQTDTYSIGTDSWEVWICDVPDGSVAITPAQAANVLNASVTSHFQLLSANLYSPVFAPAGTVIATQPSQWPENPFRLQGECEGLVAAQSGGASEGAVVVIDASYGGGYATGGFVCQVAEGCPNTYPANARIVVLGGEALVSFGSTPELRTAAHEIGHAIFWPHSYAGQVTFENGVVYEYDNPMDLMSGGDSDILNIGTIALNRYAAGWFGSEGVFFHRGGDLVYTLGARSGIQMLVLPTDVPGAFETLSVRLMSGYDSGIPVEGVEVYSIDQNSCSPTVAGGCFGLQRRTSPVPAVASFSSSEHVFGVGETFTVRGMTITILERIGETFRVQVQGQAVTERFIDDNGNLHEASIEAIAALGITRGCNPPLVDRFCPATDVTRAEMAALLITAIGEQPSAAFTGAFPDVPAGQWYTGYVERLKELGITTGNADGTYGPDRPVTRAEMAVFLNRAFALGLPTAGAAFEDVPADQWYAQAVEAIRLAGITTGCSSAPSLYCPVDPVKRDQMATFVARALGL